jgi:hypothetical protein
VLRYGSKLSEPLCDRIGSEAGTPIADLSEA